MRSSRFKIASDKSLQKHYKRLGETLVYYTININKNGKSEIEETAYRIVCASDKQYVVEHFGIFRIINIQKEKYASHSTLNLASVLDWTKGLFGYGEKVFTISIYTFSSKKIALNRMKKALQDEMRKEAWRYSFDIEKVFDNINE